MENRTRQRGLGFRKITLLLMTFVFLGFVYELFTYNSIRTFQPSYLPSRGKTSEMREDSLWLQPKLLDINFTWIQNNESICQLNKNMLGNIEYDDDVRPFPVLVHSARSHFEERVAIRKSWGSLPIHDKWDVRLIFLLGEAKSENNRENKKIVEEHSQFGDVIIGSFIDTYHNLTYKHMMGYKWILNFCRNASVVLKTDDDNFINIFQWLKWLSVDEEALHATSPSAPSPGKLSPVPDIYCKLYTRSGPFRENNSKWYVSYEDWPEAYYPPYCSGGAYSVRLDLMEKMFSVSNNVKFNWIDDVFVTGQLVQLVKDWYNTTIKIKDISSKVTSKSEDYKGMCDGNGIYKGRKRKFKVIARVNRGQLFERDMVCLWNKTVADYSKANNNEPMVKMILIMTVMLIKHS